MHEQKVKTKGLSFVTNLCKQVCKETKITTSVLYNKNRTHPGENTKKRHETCFIQKAKCNMGTLCDICCHGNKNNLYYQGNHQCYSVIG